MGEWLNEAYYSAEAVLREELEHTFTLKIERLSSDKALGGNKLRMKHFILKVSPVASALPAGIEVVPACTREFVSKARPDKTRAHPKKEGAAAAAALSSTAASEAGVDTELSFDEISDAFLEPPSAQRVSRVRQRAPRDRRRRVPRRRRGSVLPRRGAAGVRAAAAGRRSIAFRSLATTTTTTTTTRKRRARPRSSSSLCARASSRCA